MKPRTFALVTSFIFILSACTTERTPRETTIEVITYDQFQDRIDVSNDTLYVVNFWATWCKPCIQELPDFVEVDSSLWDKKPYKMILVSLDAEEMANTSVKAMVSSLGIKTEVWVMDDPTAMNDFISNTDETWSGAIPATVFYRNGEKLQFHAGTLSKQDLLNQINSHLE